MATSRLVLITPRYWPHAGDLELTAAHLAEGLAASGHDVTVLTGSWAPEWQTMFQVRGVPVIRLPHAPRGGWSTFRYLNALHRWLRRARHSLDAAYVLTARYEAYTTIASLRDTGIPVVVQIHDGGVSGDLGWQEHSRWGPRVRRRCQEAAAIVAPHAALAESLLRAGYSSDRISIIPPGVSAFEPRTADLRFRARTALADVNYDLSSAEYAPVALAIGRLDELAAWSYLIREWHSVALRWPSARLWILGDGPARDSLQREIADADLRYQLFLPGSFEDFSDLFQAADLFLCPTTLGRSQLLLEALAAGLPALAADGPDVRAMIGDVPRGLTLADRTSGTWSAILGGWLEAPPSLAAAGVEAGSIIRTRFARDLMAAAHTRLLERLRQPIPNSPSPL